MLVITRFHEPGNAEEFHDTATVVLRLLRDQRGFIRGKLGRAVDDPAWWTLTTEWENVGAYRRALSSYTVKMVAYPLFYRAYDEPSAYEVLVTADGAGVSTSPSQRGADDANRRDDE